MDEIEEYCVCYYLPEKKILIDAGAPVFDRDIEILIITHCHYDHIRYAAEIQRRTGCRIAAGEFDAKSIEEIDHKVLSDEEPVKVDIILKDGDTIKGLRVIHTPGHTEGSICLFDEKNKILFSGDTIFHGDYLGRTDLPSGNKKELDRSVEKIEKLKFDELCPGH